MSDSRRPRARIEKDEQNGPDPAGVARLIGKIVENPNPRLRYTVGPAPERLMVWLKRLEALLGDRSDYEVLLFQVATRPIPISLNDRHSPSQSPTAPHFQRKQSQIPSGSPINQ